MRPAGQRVLVIDDDEVALEVLAASIHGAGFEVVARRRAPPIQEVKKLGLAAVVCDLVMEETDGERVLARFQAEPDLREVPFVLVSADPVRLAHALTRMPWLHCVAKDGGFALLLSTLDKLMERRSAMFSAASRRFADASTSPPKPAAAPSREQARLRFFDQLHERLRLIRPYLIGGVLGPRAYGEVKKQILRLREEGASTMLGPSMDDCLDMCDQLTERAQRDLRAMELLGGVTSWLITVDASEFPLTLEGVPILRDAQSYLG